ncbi:Fur family transcriptional regulator [Chloroflexota bacterium]
METEIQATEKSIAETLKRRGYKLTPQRRAVLNAMAMSHDHVTPQTIYERVHEQYPSVGLVTVYRTLKILADLGLICEVHSGGNCRSYLITRPSEHHHHLICHDCGTVVDFTNCELSNIERRLTEETGFDIEGHLLEFDGRCPGCQE